MKKAIIAIAGIVVLIIAWWLLSPLWDNPVLDEPLPQAPLVSAAVIEDTFETMSTEMRAQFDSEVEAMSGKTMIMDEVMPPSGPVVVAMAPMVARAHSVAGTASIIEVGGEHILRFENLDTINGPDLRIYLSSGLGVSDAVDLGPIRATRGNVNYTIPAGTDISKYRNALIWCRAFSVLFSYAEF